MLVAQRVESLHFGKGKVTSSILVKGFSSCKGRFQDHNSV